MELSFVFCSLADINESGLAIHVDPCVLVSAKSVIIRDGKVFSVPGQFKLVKTPPAAVEG